MRSFYHKMLQCVAAGLHPESLTHSTLQTAYIHVDSVRTGMIDENWRREDDRTIWRSETCGHAI